MVHCCGWIVTPTLKRRAGLIVVRLSVGGGWGHAVAC